MIRNEIFSIIETLIDETHAAVFSTVDSSGAPHSRWITPGFMEERFGAIFMISARNLAKVDQVKSNPSASLLIQSKNLDKVVSVEGKVNVIDNPSIRSEVLECLGKHLHAFWKISSPETELVVLEMIVVQATLYIPFKGSKVTANFTEV